LTIEQNIIETCASTEDTYDDNIYIYIYIYINNDKVSKMTKVTSQALYKKNIEIKEKNKKINESSDDF